jgi:putative transposase
VSRLGVAQSGYYDWLQQPISNRGLEVARLLRLIRASYTASQGIYGAPPVFLDLREAGERCSKHRVARLMRVNGLRALHGYRTRRWSVVYKNRDLATKDVRDYIETFHNRARRHSHLGGLSPEQFEAAQTRSKGRLH